MRKPIQIAALRYNLPSKVEGRPDSIESEVLALCDDGTIWILMTSSNDLVPLPKIPQGPLLEDWLLDVGSILVERHHLRKDAIHEIVENFRSDLVGAFNSGVTTEDAAKTLVISSIHYS